MTEVVEVTTLGVQGLPGSVGPAGSRGAPGEPGKQGATGPTIALPGLPGADGAAGATGPAGANGTNGTNGAAGATGPAGADGAAGPAGAMGPQGFFGPPGRPGPSGVGGAAIALGGTPGNLSYMAPLVPPPLVAAWTWVNQGAATATDENGGVSLVGPAVAGDNHRLLVKTAPATPYVITAAFVPHQMYVGLVGLTWRESGSGKEHAFELALDTSSVFSVKYTNPTTFSATYTSPVMHFQGPCWFRIADDGVNRIGSISNDGYHWIPVHTVGRTDFLTADQVGIVVNPNNASLTVGMSLISWQEN